MKELVLSTLAFVAIGGLATGVLLLAVNLRLLTESQARLRLSEFDLGVTVGMSLAGRPEPMTELVAIAREKRKQLLAEYQE